jgi:hypothetical protein
MEWWNVGMMEEWGRGEWNGGTMEWWKNEGAIRVYPTCIIPLFHHSIIPSHHSIIPTFHHSIIPVVLLADYFLTLTRLKRPIWGSLPTMGAA